MNETDNRQGRRHAGLVAKLVFASIAMFGFGYALVPLYDIFCEVTGIGNSTTTTRAEAPAVLEPDYDRKVTVEFISQNSQRDRWEFKPESIRMQVHPGKLYTTSYIAKNLVSEAQVGHAVPSVSPVGATRYMHKVECFCFEEQQFAAGEERNMPVLFYIDPALPSNIGTLTLSYAFFAQERLTEAR
jgi:cytochrome c oxidase assembly protein subunit 11